MTGRVCYQNSTHESAFLVAMGRARHPIRAIWDFDPHPSTLTHLDDISGVCGSTACLCVVREWPNGWHSLDSQGQWIKPVRAISIKLETVVDRLWCSERWATFEGNLAVYVVVSTGGNVEGFVGLIEPHATIHVCMYTFLSHVIVLIFRALPPLLIPRREVGKTTCKKKEKKQAQSQPFCVIQNDIIMQKPSCQKTVLSGANNEIHSMLLDPLRHTADCKSLATSELNSGKPQLIYCVWTKSKGTLRRER